LPGSGRIPKLRAALVPSPPTQCHVMPASDSPRLVDIHCHLLPGLDDGPSDWQESLAMAELAAADGIGTIVAPPHQLGGNGHVEAAAIGDSVRQFQDVLDRRGVRLRVLPGADVRIAPELVKKIRGGEVLTLADRRRHVLLELPHEVYLPLDRVLAELSAAGLCGILSHPERNAGILRRPDVVRGLLDAGCLLQVTAGSLLGAFGPAVEQLAERLVCQGMAHFVATDAHGVRVRRPLLRAAFERVAELAGLDAARRLCVDNPACVAAGRHVASGGSVAARSLLGTWFRGRKAG